MANPAVYAVILAGGASSRFWPFDGDANPKFMLSADGEQSLLREAWARCTALTDSDKILVVTGAKQAEIVARELPELSDGNILVEPARRDTMAAAGWAMLEIASRAPNAYALLTPADSHFDDPAVFPDSLKVALRDSTLEEGRLYALGVTPSRPETGFGYIEAEGTAPKGASAAKRFVEKPDRETAEGYLAAGNYLWNVGSFFWRVSDFIQELERQHPAARAALAAFSETDPKADDFQAKFEAVHKTSIDYGIMEGAERIGVVPLDVEFDDIGTWDALASRNALRCSQQFDIDAANCLAQSHGTVAFVGVENLIVVVEGERVLVTKAGQTQDVKRAAQAFAEAAQKHE